MGIIIIGIGLFFAFKTLIAPENEGETKATSSEQPAEGEAAAEPGKEKVDGLQYAITVPSSASEKELLAMMHSMTHQKVIASDKWGIIEMNDESIEKAYSIVSASDFPSKTALMDILEKWQKGDFSQADEDHNYIWTLQKGSVGKATGLMTPEQEQEFIENNFRE